MILEQSPDGCSLSRPKAANLGLENAKGNWLIFLDDDDLFDPDHIAGLIQALHQNPQIMAAYAGVRVEVEAGQVTTLFNSSYDQRKLFATNFIPIHALLFSRSLVVAGGARFDENMEIYEDTMYFTSENLPKVQISIARDKICRKIVTYECEPILALGEDLDGMIVEEASHARK